MTQCMAGDVKWHMEVGLKQYIFQIIFHCSDGQSIALFGDKKGRCEPTVQKPFAYGKVLAQYFDQLVIDMQRAGFSTFSDHRDFVLV